MEIEETDVESPSKSMETVALYSRIFDRLKAHTRADLRARNVELPEHEDPPFNAIVVTFREREASWTKTTARLYRVALSFTLQNMGNPDAHEARRLLKRDHVNDISDDEQRASELERLKAHDSEVEAVRSERLTAIAAGDQKARTSGQKAKKLSKSDMNRLIFELQNSRSSFATATMLWFMAGYLTGLRPSEWGRAELRLDEKGRRILVVYNAKSTNGRSFGFERKLILSQLSEVEYTAVEQHSLRARREFDDDNFDDYYNGCRFLLLAINKRLWPKRGTHPTLYTTRHMFASDAKSVFSRIEVAALMGHGSDKTAGLHYGKRRFARGGVKVEPSETDVAAVAKMNPSGSGATFDRDSNSAAKDRSSTGSGSGAYL